MTLQQLNQRYDILDQTAKALGYAMKKFEGTKNVENYLGYETLAQARECVITEIQKFTNIDWKENDDVRR